MEDSLFTKIIKREIPGYFVHEDEVCVAILDKFPATRGQTLIIPRKQVDYIFDLDDETYHHLLSVAKRLAKALDQALNSERTCVVIEGFEIPHVHIRLYPIKQGGSLTLKPGEEAKDTELQELSTLLRTHLT